MLRDAACTKKFDIFDLMHTTEELISFSVHTFRAWSAFHDIPATHRSVTGGVIDLRSQGDHAIVSLLRERGKAAVLVLLARDLLKLLGPTLPPGGCCIPATLLSPFVGHSTASQQHILHCDHDLTVSSLFIRNGHFEPIVTRSVGVFVSSFTEMIQQTCLQYASEEA